MWPSRGLAPRMPWQRPRWRSTRQLEPRAPRLRRSEQSGDRAAQVHLEKRLEDGRPRPHTLTEAQLHELSFETREFSGAMLASLVNAGALAAGRAGREAVGYHDIANARPAAPSPARRAGCRGGLLCSAGPRKRTCQGLDMSLSVPILAGALVSRAWWQRREGLHPVGFLSGRLLQERRRTPPSSLRLGHGRRRAAQTGQRHVQKPPQSPCARARRRWRRSGWGRGGSRTATSATCAWPCRRAPPRSSARSCPPSSRSCWRAPPPPARRAAARPARHRAPAPAACRRTWPLGAPPWRLTRLLQTAQSAQAPTERLASAIP